MSTPTTFQLDYITGEFPIKPEYDKHGFPNIVPYLIPNFRDHGFDDEAPKMQISVHFNYGREENCQMRTVGYVPRELLDRAHAENWVDRKWKLGDVKFSGPRANSISVEMVDCCEPANKKARAM